MIPCEEPGWNGRCTALLQTQLFGRALGDTLAVFLIVLIRSSGTFFSWTRREKIVVGQAQDIARRWHLRTPGVPDSAKAQLFDCAELSYSIVQMPTDDGDDAKLLGGQPDSTNIKVSATLLLLYLGVTVDAADVVLLPAMFKALENDLELTPEARRFMDETLHIQSLCSDCSAHGHRRFPHVAERGRLCTRMGLCCRPLLASQAAVLRCCALGPVASGSTVHTVRNHALSVYCTHSQWDQPVIITRGRLLQPLHQLRSRTRCAHVRIPYGARAWGPRRHWGHNESREPHKCRATKGAGINGLGYGPRPMPMAWPMAWPTPCSMVRD